MWESLPARGIIQGGSAGRGDAQCVPVPPTFPEICPLAEWSDKMEALKEIPVVKTEKLLKNMKDKKLKLLSELLDKWSDLASTSDSKIQQHSVPVTILNID